MAARGQNRGACTASRCDARAKSLGEQPVRRVNAVLNALAAVDIALWDIAGKLAKQSVTTLLGGAKRGHVPVMASLDKYDDAKRTRARVEEALASGVAAVKVH